MYIFIRLLIYLLIHLFIDQIIYSLKGLQRLDSLIFTIVLTICNLSPRKRIWHSFPMKSINLGVISEYLIVLGTLLFIAET